MSTFVNHIKAEEGYFMINRELIRLKVVQVSYAFYQNKDKELEDVQKELLKSLSNAYYLYNMLLLLLVDIKRVAEDNVEVARQRAQRLSLSTDVNTRFIDNKFLCQLSDNKQLQSFHKSLLKDDNSTADLCNFEWRDREDVVRRILTQIQETEEYAEYMKAEHTTYEEDRDFWRKIYRSILTDNAELDEELEGLSLYWNDDKSVVDTFVLKTIRRFEEGNGAEQTLLPAYQTESDKEFAMDLLRNSISNANTYRDLIDQNARNWNMQRMPLMDVVILQTALAEIISIPTIPVGVSINEYVEIAKMYSTPRSGSYVNGMLDTISKKLAAENKLIGKPL